MFPLLWVNIKQKYVNTTINYKIRQNVAAKFLSVKLIKGSNASATSNIDVYNFGIKAVPLDLTLRDFC